MPRVPSKSIGILGTVGVRRQEHQVGQTTGNCVCRKGRAECHRQAIGKPRQAVLLAGLYCGVYAASQAAVSESSNDPVGRRRESPCRSASDRGTLLLDLAGNFGAFQRYLLVGDRAFGQITDALDQLSEQEAEIVCSKTTRRISGQRLDFR